MPLVDPSSFAVVRSDFRVETETFKNVWVNPGGQEVAVELTLTCRGLDNADGYVVLDQSSSFAMEYTAPDGMFPKKVIDLGGVGIAMSREMCQSVCNVLLAQAGPERYDFEALCKYAVLLETTWYSVMTWVGSLSKRRKEEGKKP